MTSYQQIFDIKKLKEFRDDMGLHFNRAIKAVPLIGITITNEIRNDELEVLREHLNTIFPQVPPNWNTVNQ